MKPRWERLSYQSWSTVTVVRRVALAGNSWSGGWALAFAQRHPERVSRLALLDATALDTPDVWTCQVLSNAGACRRASALARASGMDAKPHVKLIDAVSGTCSIG